MSEIRSTSELTWHQLRSAGAAESAAPPVPGVYAYAEAPQVHGLPASLSWIYVGKARNLRSRLRQHSVEQERHEVLRQWLQFAHDKQVWFAAVGEAHLDLVERDLIVRLAPKLNRIKYRQHTPDAQDHQSHRQATLTDAPIGRGRQGS